MRQNNSATATFAGGCFWCMESPFLKHEGVLQVKSGYTGGRVVDPTYQQVTSGETGHYEAVQITYDPATISYAQLLEVFWRQIDPTDPGGSFVDRGPQYRSAIFYHSPAQKELAEKSKKDLDQSGPFEKPVVTRILPASTFYPAEDYHQKFFLKSPQHYQRYRSGSGRDAALAELWGE